MVQREVTSESYPENKVLCYDPRLHLLINDIQVIRRLLFVLED